MAQDGRIAQIARLYPATFRGVPMFISTSSVAGGRKATVRPLVNSDEQNVSDVGLKQRTYTIEGYVSARYREGSRDNDSGISSDYEEQRKRILAALESRDPGILVHPWEGEIRNLVAIDWTLNERMTEVGRGPFSITFVRHTLAPKPAADTTTTAEIEGLREACTQAYKAQIEDRWVVDLSFINGAEDAIAKVQEAVDAVDDAIRVVERVEAEINGVSSALADLTSGVASIITAPIGVATTIQNAFTAIENVFPTLAAKWDSMTSAFSFGSLDVAFDYSTPAGAQKKRNFDAINAAMQAAFLSEAYDAALGLDLSTVSTLDAVEKTLGDQHRAIVEGTEASDELKGALTDLRVAFSAFLRDARLTALKVTPATVGISTPRTLSYQFYGDDSRSADLAALNGVSSYDTLKGEVLVLSR